MFMRMMFLAPLAGALIYLLTGVGMSWVRTRLSKLLFNSSIAVVASACLVKGIVEVSGRTTSVDMPYWYVAGGLLCLSIMTGLSDLENWHKIKALSCASGFCPALKKYLG